jgi:hypothetical protein
MKMRRVIKGSGVAPAAPRDDERRVCMRKKKPEPGASAILAVY